MSVASETIVVIADIRARSGREADLLYALEAAVQDTRAKDGCLLFRLQKDISDPGHVVLYELGRDLASVDAHHVSAGSGANRRIGT